MGNRSRPLDKSGAASKSHDEDANKALEARVDSLREQCEKQIYGGCEG